ncbi:hypothetical protein L227DRAFT_179605 [Lentinus tigrinus ALCF2SS1-6]|uniref:Uncharacterized protein n=1 Tax=Lentinus tigrinus ALCF2SS1-6 TaxID=1328759 RepID=A0A5C2S4E3_9APHY|nr:hypothetical protein L227DRAFT_179605 [Lentinus tigrinus ALCF2SS1-6]
MRLSQVRGHRDVGTLDVLSSESCSGVCQDSDTSDSYGGLTAFMANVEAIATRSNRAGRGYQTDRPQRSQPHWLATSQSS